jgi:HTH-type transcriptional regulator/antitoxin HigA
LKKKEANTFAANSLVPSAKYERWVSGTTFFDVNMIRQFAQDIGIHPGIVVGRLQHDHFLKPAFHNDLKQAIRFD